MQVRKGANWPGRRRASAPRVCAQVRWRHARTTLKEALSCVGGRARLHEETRAQSRDDAWLRGVSEKLGLLKKVDRSSGHGSPCRGGRMKVAVGLPAKEVLTHLYVDLPSHSEFERAQPRKALVLGEGPAEISILECMCASSSPLPKPLQGGVRSSELSIVSLQLGADLGEFPHSVASWSGPGELTDYVETRAGG
ncbi:hypothetical protein CDL15_Pgr017492 [Punica granatum]|uniref:Uncharacterized protein n=1 Tax=Punica granatum TaxID=22663 RepID=A0A218XHU5_PUNGR|nr:hypothetical protein CDL15_Pgr017492 [Punica granatum]